MSPVTGQVIDGDTVTIGIQGDTPLTPVGNYVAAAYTNNYTGAVSTTSFAINAQGNRLVRIGGVGGTPLPEFGQVHDIGPLGVTTDQSAALDAAVMPVNRLYAHVSSVGLCTVERQTGAVKIIGPIAGSAGITDIAVLSVAANVYALTADNHLLHFKNYAPETTLADVAITGMVDGAIEALIAIDVRPKTGVLYGISSQKRIYVVDPRTGVATLVDTLPTGIARPFENAVGMDFDPVSDELRIVNGGKLNRRWNPDTRVVTEATDLNELNVVGIAYANHLNGTQPGWTTLLGITTSEMVVIGSLLGVPSADNGAVLNIGPLGMSPAHLMGFDLGPRDDQALFGTREAAVDQLFHVAPRSAIVERIGTITNTHLAVIGLAIAPPGRLEFSTSAITVNETAGTATVTLARLGGSDGPLSVEYRSTSSGLDATPTTDYTPVSGTLFFADGETSKTITIPILNDPDPETSERFAVTLQAPSIGIRFGEIATVTVTIEDERDRHAAALTVAYLVR